MKRKVKTIFTLSTIHVYYPGEHIYSREWRSVLCGWFSSAKIAEKCLINNAGNLQDNYEHYAVIESVSEGPYPCAKVIEVKWFKFYHPKKFWDPDCVYVKECKKPKLLKNSTCFCGIG